MAGRGGAQASADGWFCGCLPFLQSFRRNSAPRRGRDSLAEPNELHLVEADEEDDHPLYAAKLRRVGAPTPETMRADRAEAKAVKDLWAQIGGKVCSLKCVRKIERIRVLRPSEQQHEHTRRPDTNPSRPYHHQAQRQPKASHISEQPEASSTLGESRASTQPASHESSRAESPAEGSTAVAL